MKIISVVNYKGGVGKSTIVSNLGSLLALKGNRVLLVDLDPQANLTFLFINVDLWKEHYKEDKTIMAWYNDTINNKKLVDIKKYITSDLVINEKSALKNNKKLSIIPSHTDLYEIQIDLARNTQGRINRSLSKNFLFWISKLGEALERLSGEYDYILLDCQPGFDIITQSAIYASDAFIIPTKLDYLSTIGVVTLLDHIKSLSAKIENGIKLYNFKSYKNVDAKFLGVVPTMVNYYARDFIKINRQYRSQLINSGIKVFNSSIRAAESEINNDIGIPYVLKNVSSKRSDLYNDFENLMMECIKGL